MESKSIKEHSELMSRFISVPDFAELTGVPWNVSYGKIQLKYLQRYLNALVVNTQLSDFPNDFIRNDGALILEITTNLNNGKKLSGADADRGDKVTTDPVLKRRDAISKLLHMLQGAGALLSHVKPEFLLSKADFLSLMMAKVTRQLLGIDHFGAPEMSSFDQKIVSEFTSSKPFSEALMSRLKVLELVYQNLANESWMFVLMQICKIFILGKIDHDRLVRTSGYSDSIKALQLLSSRFSTGQELMAEVNRSGKSVLASNIYGQAEGCLLKWVSIHHCKVTENLQQPLLSFWDLCDSLALGSLIRSHTSLFTGTLVENQPGQVQKEQNAIELMSALKTLKLGFSPSPEEIFKGTPPILAMSVAYLYETLPHYLPLMQVEFATALHKPVTKTVAIQNPSRGEILYQATLEGNSNFVLSAESVTVPPNANVDFPIEFCARTMKGVTARLTLKPSRPKFAVAAAEPGADGAGSAREGNQSPVFFAPIVIDLVSNVTFSQPDSSCTMEGVLYQSTKLVIPVRNLIGTPCRMKLTSKTSVLSEDTKPQSILSDQIMELIQTRNEETPTGEKEEKDNQFKNIVAQHKSFLFSHRVIDFPREDSEMNLEVEFVPIRMATYRCLVLFNDEKSGEFVLDIVATTVLPPPTEIAASKLRAESGNRCSYVQQLELVNASFIRAVAYSLERHYSLVNSVSERKFKDMMTRRTRECDILYRQQFTSQRLKLVNSSVPFFEVPNEVILQKQSLGDSKKSDTPQPQRANSLPIIFKPTKAGDYPCKLLLMSTYDVRAFNLHAVGVAATRELSMDFSTVAGKSMKQEIPLPNTSQEAWTFKLTISGDSSFSAPTRLSVKASSCGYVPVTFVPAKIGTFSAQLTIVNLVKESTVIYNLAATVDEPPAEQKFIVQCQARVKKSFSFPVKSNIIKSGKIQVTTTVPVISFAPDVEFVNGEMQRDFSYTVFAQRSGIAAGTIVFTDPQTKNFVWFVLEVHVDPPAPEQTISVQTIARTCVTVKIPIANPKSHDCRFTVVLSDDDLFGDKVFVVPSQSTLEYILVISPLKEMKRLSSLYFYSDDDGEFWYSLKIEATNPPESTLAPLISPLGKFVSSFILIENPLDKPATFRVENSNPTSFHLVARRVLQLAPKEKKRIEIRYIPSTVGVKETASISFTSNEVGDWFYNITGTGKPPQPQSPVIVASTLDTTNSALVIFNNPFPYPARFSVSLSSQDEANVFKFLVRRKVFTLNSFDQEFQIPFTFTPVRLGQTQAHIVVASLGPARGPLPKLDEAPGIRWVFPLIGTGKTSETPTVQTVHCRAHVPVEPTMQFTLSGETEVFGAHEYSLKMELPPTFEFLQGALDCKATALARHENAVDLSVVVRFTPMRPFMVVVPLKIRNPLGQEWQFEIDLRVDRGKPSAAITVESFLNKVGKAKVVVPFAFNVQTPFHAYFMQGSASEFSLDAQHGFVEPTIRGDTELPVMVVFEPKMYGKVLKGVLVVDTLEAQWLFDVVGKTPEYSPPVVQADPSRFMAEVAEAKRAQTAVVKKRNVIRDNIENAKIAKPKPVSPVKP
jgi:hypothetical protein